MALHQITEDQAFAMMRTASQHEHVKPRDLAEEVILTGALPDRPGRRPAA
jgi:AmiR/NasT family two-component response regulator